MGRLLPRTLAHGPAALDELDEYVTVLPGTPGAVPGDIGIGVAVYIGRDPALLLATSRQVPGGPHHLAVAVFLGPSEQAPAIEGSLLALGEDGDAAASVVAALVEAALLGPYGTDGLTWPAGAPPGAVSHVASGFVAQGTMQEVFVRGRATGWGVGRARGASAGGRATRQALAARDPDGSGSDAAVPMEGMVVARVGSAVVPAAAHLAIALELPPSLAWRVAVFRADGLDGDELEIVMVGGEDASPPAAPVAPSPSRHPPGQPPRASG